uniref:5'-nucleotidase n=1 Tax=uncultured Nocardioidaceae bacterium TaxID=253824 RepID=A0A6J4KN73_9ACTN|nr:MAG: 5'-nucleotidase [uncultured Nocardioidaceae bacterium]
MHVTRRRAGALTVAALTSVALGATALTGTTASAAKPSGTTGERAYAQLAPQKDYIKLDLLALNDFHGNLEVVDPTKSSSGRINDTPAGGVAYLARLIRNERAKSRAAGAVPYTVAAGDLIGASPLISAAFHDEPTIKAMNRIGLQAASVGNHEFDEGWRELRRMQNGGCLEDGDGANGQDSCPAGRGFAGANFQYLGANVKWEDPSTRGRDTVFPATKIIKVEGVKVAFIGMTLEGTGSIVSQAGIKGIDFTDEVKTANALVPRLRERGVRSVIVLLHEGIAPDDSTAYNDCTGPAGPALEIGQRLSPAIDAIVTGHTHQPYNCVVNDPAGNPRLLTSAASFGRMVTKLHLLIDPDTRDIVRPAAFAENMIVENDDTVEPAHDLARLVDTYRKLVEPIANEVIGQFAPEAEPNQVITKEPDPDGGDSALGNLIADAQKADESIVTAGGQAPVIAFMNPGGIRADLAENGNGDVTYGNAFSVQPFNNFVVSMDMTGDQIRALLNEQWNGPNEGAPKILQVSGLTYTWDASLAAEPSTDAIVGTPLVDHDADPQTAMVPLVGTQTYRVAANNFISDGGDSFSTFTSATNKLVGGLDIDSLREYLLANSPVSPTPTNRISQVP